ncbi:LD-carboxypeptidase [Metamycoplasma neophronis]|uniref:LD-carboxypeptidase N-terminal domain-containing protein n=1 Tax=Metamycoplasma neophronis TaxID=872983 RepID=A0ABY2YZQ3_9BACT|nr:LD-carboxypeptidase [Metamycoplasma neophronis]TPR53847.1 hypothetical protein FJR74_01630 [Metamycoplasma neophronis]
MSKIKPLKDNNQVEIISLSSGLLGEKFCAHQVELGQKRLQEFNLLPRFSKHCLMGLDFIDKNPDKRAKDLINAFLDKNIKGIICAIGGFDTYRTIPYILDNPEYVAIIKANPKIFLGYSDTTINHLMLNKLNVPSFYGQAFITDLAELNTEMLPYNKDAFEWLFKGDKKEYKISDVWYEERKDFSSKSLNTSRNIHKEEYGFLLLQGKSKFSGILLGGCLESIAALLDKNNSAQYEINKNTIYLQIRLILIKKFYY